MVLRIAFIVDTHGMTHCCLEGFLMIIFRPFSGARGKFRAKSMGAEANLKNWGIKPPQTPLFHLCMLRSCLSFRDENPRKICHQVVTWIESPMKTDGKHGFGILAWFTRIGSGKIYHHVKWKRSRTWCSSVVCIHICLSDTVSSKSSIVEAFTFLQKPVRRRVARLRCHHDGNTLLHRAVQVFTTYYMQSRSYSSTGGAQERAVHRLHRVLQAVHRAVHALFGQQFTCKAHHCHETERITLRYAPRCMRRGAL